MATEHSPQADALVQALQRQRAGRLTVFLGAAPGVGKTYAMLARARELQRQGTDVLIGIVETHGRSETLAMAEGLPVLPRRLIDYQGRRLEEMDLDAILARKPAVVLVDELAHRNRPGSRHERRWQDVDELLDAGIDVYTTVNIQHLESLNDVVLQITGIRVSETVPDAVFDRLRDIRLVDLPARELIERLKQGKVYLPEQAAQALQAFFSPANLTALRELAMQTVADHVDADLREVRTARGLAGIPLQRDVLIAIDGRGQSDYMVRAGARIAERRGAPWSVVTVDTGHSAAAMLRMEGDARGDSVRSHAALAEQQRQLELDRAFALARSLGGATEVLHDTDVAQALLDAAEARGARSIVIGRTRERPIARMFNRTLTQQLLQRGGRFELTIVSTPQARQRARQRRSASASVLAKGETALIALATLGATAIAAAAERWVGLVDLSMVFLIAVLLVASRSRMVAAAITALLCFLAYDFLFIEPRFTFLISAPRGVATVLLFLAAAMIAGRLASRLRMQVLALRAANSHATAVQNLARQLAKSADLGQVIAAGASGLQAALRAQAWLRVGSDTGPAALAPGLSDKDLAAADWTQRHGVPSGRYTDTLSDAAWWFLPMPSGAGALGVVGLKFASGMPRLSFEQRRLAESMAEDIAQAAQRARMVAELEDARMDGETERLRSALLSSVAHDLRAPLASLVASADRLRAGAGMDEAGRQSQLQAVRAEGERLERYVQNLLDMTRLGRQGLALSRAWIGVDALVGSAVRRLERLDPAVPTVTDLQPGLGQVHVHPALVEQALFNVLENAARYATPGRPVRIGVSALPPQMLQIDISDEGPGLPEEERRRIFDLAHPGLPGEGGLPSPGLGLAIVRSIVGAHMGQVEALPGPQGRGTTIRLRLPTGGESPAGELADTSSGLHATRQSLSA